MPICVGARGDQEASELLEFKVQEAVTCLMPAVGIKPRSPEGPHTSLPNHLLASLSSSFLFSHGPQSIMILSTFKVSRSFHLSFKHI